MHCVEVSPLCLKELLGHAAGSLLLRRITDMVNVRLRQLPRLPTDLQDRVRCPSNKQWPGGISVVAI